MTLKDIARVIDPEIPIWINELKDDTGKAYKHETIKAALEYHDTSAEILNITTDYDGNITIEIPEF